MTIIIVIMMVNIADAKAKLSELVEAASHGERVIICNRNEPVAELRAMEIAPKTPRDLAPLYPDWTLDPAFFEPLESDDLEAWYGETGRNRRVSEARPTYSSRGRQGRLRR
jgi:antitoxin (DNA-binding transcriptional repressor) of toxin-antitoxin stability system